MKQQRWNRALAMALSVVALLAFLPASALSATAVSVVVKDDIGEPVAGARVALLEDADTELMTKISDAGGIASFPGVEDGAYTVTVDRVPAGYNLKDNEYVSFAVSGTDVNGGGEIVLTVIRASTEIVFPILDVRGNAVVGAVFNVASRSGTYIENYTTTSSGLTLELPEGTYVITNVQTPASHRVSGASCTITVDENGKCTYNRDPSSVFILELSEHTLTFTKRDDGGNPVPGAVFHIAGSGINTTITSDSAGVVTIAGLLASGSYVLSERSAPTGYTKSSATVTVTVEADGKHTTDADPEEAFVNKRTSHQLTFTLRNDGGAAVSGATFRLESESGATYDATSELGTGRVLFTGIPFGTYTLTQSGAAEGYPVSSGKVIVTIYSDGGISFSSDPAEVFVAERTRYAFSFTAKEERGGNLDGATFKLVGGALTLTQKSLTGGKVSFGDLLPGTYTLSQTATPAGYSPSTETVTVNVSEEGVVTFSTAPEETIIATIAKFSVSFDKMDDQGAPVAGAIFRLTGTGYERDVTSTSAGKVSFAGLSEGTYTLTERSAPTGYALSNASITITVSSIGHTTYSRDPAQAFANARTQYELSFLTVDDTGEPIKDAVFTLSGSADTREGTSSRKGKVTFTKLPHGTYILRQKAAPEGYTRSPLIVQVTIEPSGRMLYALVIGDDFPNEPLLDLDGVFVNTTGPISFSFSSLSDDMRPLADAAFALVDKKSGATVVAKSNTAGVATFYGISPGEYTLRQTEAPVFYIPSDETYGVTANTGGFVSITQAPAGGEAEAEDTLLFSGEMVEGETTFVPAVAFISEREKRSILVRCETRFGGMPVSGAVFSAIDLQSGSSIGLLITGADGRATLGSVAPGVYSIQAESAPTGYEFVLDGEPLTIRVTENGDPEALTVQVNPVAVEALAQPEGLVATVVNFMASNAWGIAAASAGVLLLAAMALLLIKR